MKKILWMTGVLLFAGSWGWAGTAEVLPGGTGLGGVYFSSFPYQTAWDGDGRRQAVGTQEIQQVNAMLGAEVVGGAYRADYDYFTFDVLAGVTDRTTVRVQLPYFRSEVNQRVDVFAPPPVDAAIRAQLEAMDFRTERLEGDGWGDVMVWVYHQYYRSEAGVKLLAGAGWRSPVTATRFAQNTEKLNVGTLEAETLLLTHNADVRLAEYLLLNYRLEVQVPFEGDQDVFVPGAGVVNVPQTPGWQVTHDVELKTEWLERRVTVSGGVWYREEGADEVNGVRGGDKDALWYTAALGYSGMKDYEEGRLKIPVFAEVRYWYLEEARNFRAYYDSYWEFWVALPLWSR